MKEESKLILRFLAYVGLFFFEIGESKGGEFTFGIIKFEVPNRQPRRGLKKMGSNMP